MRRVPCETGEDVATVTNRRAVFNDETVAHCVSRRN